jgi:hypothetical protein
MQSLCRQPKSIGAPVVRLAAILGFVFAITSSIQRFALAEEQSTHAGHGPAHGPSDAHSRGKGLAKGMDLAGGRQLFGQDFMERGAVSFAEMMINPKAHLGHDMTVEAKIDKVCQSSGCWFESKGENGEPYRIVFKDYAFTIPKTSAGKTAWMIGQVEAKELSVKEQRHYLKDAKATKKEIESVKGPKTVYQFVVRGIKI